MKINLEQAAQNLLNYWDSDEDGLIQNYITALREALAEQAKQEPVAVVGFDTQGWRNLVDALTKLPDGTKLYAEPANKTEEKPLLVQAWEKRFAEQAEQEIIPSWEEYCECEGIPCEPVKPVDLTDDEIYEVCKNVPFVVIGPDYDLAIARAVIEKFKEKNK